MQRTQNICLVLLATIAVSFSLFYLKSVLLPFVIALFVVIGCRPILEFVEKQLKLPRSIAFGLSFLIGNLLLIGFALLLWFSITDLQNKSSVYEKRMNIIATWVVEKLPSDPPTPEPNESDNDTPNQDISATPPAFTGNSDLPKNPKAAVQEIFQSISNFIQEQLVRLASSLANLLSYGILILIFVFFLLMGNTGQIPGPDVINENQPRILGEIEEQIRKYLFMKTVISMFTGLAFGLVLWIFGVPLATVFGFLAFLLNFIPNIGPLIGCALPVPFLILNSNISPTAGIICFVLIGTIQFVSGNVIETRIMGKSFDVSPITLLLALMFFGLIWGIIGMFLATPIVSILKIVLHQRESTRPIADLLAGRLDVFNSMED
ncbi:MAG: AI-2E family transporter [Planctomycetaceae bacterium]|nr:AI-2E family transporter [Planctomycetaceae bacterium]MCP4775119.1 AI-2E family transporter [Planctomycetaceae bacterium]